MTDTILDWDSLWDRVTKNIDTNKIQDESDFKQTMTTDFFKGHTNPQGMKDGHKKLMNELWDHALDNRKLPNIDIITDEKGRFTVPKQAKPLLKKSGKEWKRGYSYTTYTWKSKPAECVRNTKGRFVTWQLKK